MALPRFSFRKTASITAVFLVTLLVLALLNRPPSTPPLDRGSGGSAARSTEERIRELQRAIRNDPGRSAAYALLGDAYLQRVRETGDPSYYDRAEGVLQRAIERDPRDAAAVTGMGAVASARHDFRAALRYGRRGRALAPSSVRPYGVVVDALVELGRYDQAARELQRMVDLKPDLASYARVSYFRELQGDLEGAIEAMGLAVSSARGAPENTAYVQTLLGNLELTRGRRAAARNAYRTALDRLPGYLPARAGLARLAAAGGRPEDAIRGYRAVVARLPLPEYVIALGETELAAGHPTAARRDFELVRAQRRLLATAGVNTDVELAVFEADHGNRRRGLLLARRAWRSAPGVRSADAVGWALTRTGRPAAGLAWARKALRLGSRDPLFRLHAGVAASRAGLAGEADQHLRIASEGAAALTAFARAELRRAR